MRRDVFQAIAPLDGPSLALLLYKPTPNALVDHFDSSRQAPSKHIKILTDCQLIKQAQFKLRNQLKTNPLLFVKNSKVFIIQAY